MDQIEVVQSNKGGIKIIYNGYMYTIHKAKKCGGIRWRCAQRSYNCRVSIGISKIYCNFKLLFNRICVSNIFIYKIPLCYN